MTTKHSDFTVSSEYHINSEKCILTGLKVNHSMWRKHFHQRVVNTSLSHTHVQTHRHRSWDKSFGNDLIPGGWLVAGNLQLRSTFYCCLTANSWGMCFLWHRKWEVKGPRLFLCQTLSCLQKCSVIASDITASRRGRERRLKRGREKQRETAGWLVWWVALSQNVQCSWRLYVKVSSTSVYCVYMTHHFLKLDFRKSEHACECHCLSHSSLIQLSQDAFSQQLCSFESRNLVFKAASWPDITLRDRNL